MPFIATATGSSSVTIYSDGSFEQVEVTSLSIVPSTYDRGATGIYAPATATPVGRATDEFYKELLGIALEAMVSNYIPIQAYSDCPATYFVLTIHTPSQKRLSFY